MRLIREYFVNLHKKHPKGSAQAMGWGSLSSQHLRLNTIIDIMDTYSGLDSVSILDVGCGSGAILHQLPLEVLRSEHFEYFGIDINSAVIEESKENWQFQNCSFAEGTVDTMENTSFDWVIGSGIFCLAFPGCRAYIEDTIQHMVSLAKIGVVVNFLFKDPNRKISTLHDDMYYTTPAEILLLNENVSDTIVIQKNYLPNDFTMAFIKSGIRE